MSATSVYDKGIMQTITSSWDKMRAKMSVYEVTGHRDEGYLECDLHRGGLNSAWNWCQEKADYVAANQDASLMGNQGVIQVPIFPSVSGRYGWAKVLFEDHGGLPYGTAQAWDAAYNLDLGFVMPGEGRLVLRSTFLVKLEEVDLRMKCHASTHNPGAQHQLQYDLEVKEGQHLVQKYFIWHGSMCKICAAQTEKALEEAGHVA